MSDPRSSWWEAVTLAARGEYATAWRHLSDLDADPGTPPALASLVESTRASHLRQLGWPEEAVRRDEAARGLAEQALAHAAGDPGALEAHVEAYVEALIGIAADAVAAGEPDDAALAEARDRLGAIAEDRLVRVRVRWHWVGAEAAMLVGDAVTAARRADDALDRAGRVGERHVAKSLVIAAACAETGLDTAAERIAAADALIRSGGWATLAWPLALVARDLGGRGAPIGDPAGIAARGAAAAMAIAAHLPEHRARDWLSRPGIRDLVHGAGR